VGQQKLKWLESQYKSNTKKNLVKNCEESHTTLTIQNQPFHNLVKGRTAQEYT